jgi:hypothetical protein
MIAVKLLYNLSRILAGRLATATLRESPLLSPRSLDVTTKHA